MRFRISSLVNAIAYDPNLFSRSVSALQALVGLDQSTKGDNNGTRKNLTTLFQVVHSGTHAPIGMRTSAIREMLSSHDEHVFDIGLHCLDASLQTLGLSVRVTIDSELAVETTAGGHNRWTISSSGSPSSWRLRAISPPPQTSAGRLSALRLESAPRTFCTDDKTIDSLVQLTPVFQTEDGWPEAWTAAKLLLRRTNISEDLRRRVATFAQTVAPRGLRQRVVAKLHSRELFDDEDFEVDQYVEREQESQLEAVSVGRELGKDKALLMEMLPRLMDRGSRGMPFSLGQGVAAATEISLPFLAPSAGF